MLVKILVLYNEFQKKKKNRRKDGKSNDWSLELKLDYFKIQGPGVLNLADVLIILAGISSFLPIQGLSNQWM